MEKINFKKWFEIQEARVSGLSADADAAKGGEARNLGNIDNITIAELLRAKGIDVQSVEDFTDLDQEHKVDAWVNNGVLKTKQGDLNLKNKMLQIVTRKGEKASDDFAVNITPHSEILPFGKNVSTYRKEILENAKRKGYKIFSNYEEGKLVGSADYYVMLSVLDNTMYIISKNNLKGLVDQAVRDLERSNYKFKEKGSFGAAGVELRPSKRLASGKETYTIIAYIPADKNADYIVPLDVDDVLKKRDKAKTIFMTKLPLKKGSPEWERVNKLQNDKLKELKSSAPSGTRKIQLSPEEMEKLRKQMMGESKKAIK